MTERVLVAWSGGKDSALALHKIKESDGYAVAGLLTTVTEDYERISMHGVRLDLLKRQAARLGYPLEMVFIPKECCDEDYDTRMRESLERWYDEGVRSVVFGDLYLADIRDYREKNLEKASMKGIFPLWGSDTHSLALRFIELGFKAVLTCVDGTVLGKDYAGREYDRNFLEKLPESVDPCGENGEFHTFVYDGPIFKKGIDMSVGRVVLRDNRFYFCDFLEKGMVESG